MPRPFDIPTNLPPDQLAGHLDQASLAVVDSEGAVLGPKGAAEDAPAASLDPVTQAALEAARPSAPARRRLPDRRQTVGVHILHDGVSYAVDLGLHPEDGKVSEIFIAGPGGTDADDALLQDMAAIVSLALQCGIPAEALADIVGRRAGIPGADGFASILGATLEEICKINSEPKLL